ncbi:MAG: hypothetical protein ACLU99_01325 [Alphaproteobacteria bacterium]
MKFPKTAVFWVIRLPKSRQGSHQKPQQRRLRAAAREVFPDNARVKTDYVLIGRYNTADIEFKKLVSEMKKALCKNKQNDVGTAG